MVVVAYGLTLNSVSLTPSSSASTLHSGEGFSSGDETGTAMDECGFEFVEGEDTTVGSTPHTKSAKQVIKTDFALLAV